MKEQEIMNLGIDEARITMLQNIGGPFGAVIVDKDQNIIAVASNTVLRDNDPTAHAEVNAIRQACKKLKTYDLSEYELYATGYPCPMCMSAIIWSNIKKIYVCASYQEAAKIGFRDSHISNFLKNDCQDESILNIVQLDDSKVKELYKQYTNLHKKIY